MVFLHVGNLTTHYLGNCLTCVFCTNPSYLVFADGIADQTQVLLGPAGTAATRGAHAKISLGKPRPGIALLCLVISPVNRKDCSGSEERSSHKHPVIDIPAKLLTSVSGMRTYHCSSSYSYTLIGCLCPRPTQLLWEGETPIQKNPRPLPQSI